MVEGPGCKLKGEKLQDRATRQEVKGVKGTAVDQHVKKKKVAVPMAGGNAHVGTGNDLGGAHAPSVSPYHQLIGHQCSGVRTIGKELFMFFDGLDQCLRIHFLMAGGFRVNGEKIDGDGGGDANGNAPSLVLLMSKDQIVFNKCAIEMRSSKECQARIVNFKHLDICGPHFSHQRALENLVSQCPSRIVSDLLLDQDVLPGVGNIIKNEAMFDSRIKPDARLATLSEEHLRFLVKMTRDFSMLFYECRRTGKALEPHLKVYRKSKCKVCGEKVTTTRLGEDNPRLTSYCPTCQDNDISKLQGKQSAKNTLLGWVRTGHSVEELSEEWSCEACTYLNKPTCTNCIICLTPRHKPKPAKLSNKNSPLKKRKLTSSPQTDQTTLNLNSTNTLSEPPAKKPKLAPSSSSLQYPSANISSNITAVNKAVEGASSSCQPSPGAITSAQQYCPQHRAPCVIREVRKNNHNKQRMFHSCPIRQCSFFMWADEAFPECEGHGKRCVLRTVYKEGVNNGRKFFACSMPKNKQCQKFEWADQYNDVTIR